MEKNIIQINQEILKNTLKDAAKTALDEIDHNGEDNNCAAVDEDSLQLLTQCVRDDVGDSFVLTFGLQHPDKVVSNVTFTLESVILLTEKRFVIEGIADVSRIPKLLKKYRIDYKFDDSSFFEAVCCKNGTVRDMRPLKLDFAGDFGRHNVQNAIKLIQILTKWLYSESYRKTKIAEKGLVLERKINPLTGR